MPAQCQYLKCLFVFSFIFFSTAVFALPGNGQGLADLKLVNRFYDLNHHILYWYKDANAAGLRSSFIRMLDSCAAEGLEKEDYHYDVIRSLHPTDSTELWNADELYTDAAIHYFKDLYQGHNVAATLSYDELSPEYADSDTQYILGQLLQVHGPGDLDSIAARLVPGTVWYKLLRAELSRQMEAGDNAKVKELQHAMNLQRWLFHFGLSKFILVNIAAAKLKYYENGELSLYMKVVAGKPWTRTPRFAAHCNEIVFYPYWHVPRSIALKEVLPLCKKSPGALEKLDLQVVNANGVIVDPHSVNWKAVNAGNLKYSFRQPTGCDNALGVIKFNLTDPFSVYMHDTNMKSAFALSNRYRSHGCIRLEKPVELAGRLLSHVVDTAFLSACIRGQKPVVNNIDIPVPVFVVYTTVDFDTVGHLVYYNDVYHLH